MNESNFAHAGLALVMQLITALIATAFGADFVSAVAYGWMLATGFYAGREVTQVERKYGGKPWWIGFDLRRWSLDSVLDLLFPMTACAGVFVIAMTWR